MIRVEQCEVKLIRNPGQKFKIKVRVRSKKREGLLSENEIDPGKYSGQRDLLVAIGVAGAATAEYLCDRYGDNFNLPKYAEYAQRAFLEECHLCGEKARTIPEKIKRLRSMDPLLFDAMFQDWQKEFVDELEYAISKGTNPTADDAAVLDHMIGTIHQNQNG